jgi:hypothetical protein
MGSFLEMKPVPMTKSPPTDDDPLSYPVLPIWKFCFGVWLIGETYQGYMFGPLIFLHVNRLNSESCLLVHRFDARLGLLISRGFAIIARYSYWLQISRDGTGFYIYDRRRGYHWPGW